DQPAPQGVFAARRPRRIDEELGRAALELHSARRLSDDLHPERLDVEALGPLDVGGGDRGDQGPVGQHRILLRPEEPERTRSGPSRGLTCSLLGWTILVWRRGLRWT